MTEPELWIPDGTEAGAALARTTHLAVAAHPDDIEFMAYDGILQCTSSPDLHFTAAVLTDGSGSPRSGPYRDCTDGEMRRIRKEEQKKAAAIGGYNAQIFLNLSSAQVRDPADPAAVEGLKRILSAARPSCIYTHNPADRHDTHVATVLRLVQALRELEYLPAHFWGCEVWRSLDWVCDPEKIAFVVDGRPDLERALLEAFDSQIAGGKRYDLAVLGRRRANATFGASHQVDAASGVIYAVDLLPLLREKDLSAADYIAGYIDRFRREVTARVKRLGG